MMTTISRSQSMGLCSILATVALALLSTMPQPVFAQSAAATPKGVQILLLGTKGGPSLSRERSETAVLLVVDGRRYLIDCGIGTMRRLLEAGVKSQTIGTMFITHAHPDHTLGLVDVLGNDYLEVDGGEPDTAKEFNIYGPPETPALVSAAYDFIKVPYSVFAAEPIMRSTLINPFRAHAITHDGLIFQDDKIRVTAAENSHYVLMPAKYHASMKSYSYRFETRYGAIVFTGDTGTSAAVEALAKHADVLISEVEDLPAIVKSVSPTVQEDADKIVEHMRREHLPMQAVGELATKAQVKAVLLYHYVGGGVGERFAADVRQAYSGPVFAGTDLARYCIGDGAAFAGLRPCP